MTKYIDKGVVISECGNYRPILWRIWDDTLPILTWGLLHPSRADGKQDDATARKAVGFSSLWRQGGKNIVNWIDYRAAFALPLKILVSGKLSEKIHSFF